MTTKVIFNMDKTLKAAAMKKARAKGLTLSSALNMLAESFVSDDVTLGAFEKRLHAAREDVRRGRLYTHDEVVRELGL